MNQTLCDSDNFQKTGTRGVWISKIFINWNRRPGFEYIDEGHNNTGYNFAVQSCIDVLCVMTKSDKNAAFDVVTF
jgi:hypothetical protein